MSDKYAKTLKLLAAVTPALDNNTQGQAAAGIQSFWRLGNLAKKYGNLAKWPFRPTSSLLRKFYPRNINHMPAVKFSSRLDLERKFSFFKAPIYC
jgi:hypothetical protein